MIKSWAKSTVYGEDTFSAMPLLAASDVFSNSSTIAVRAIFKDAAKTTFSIILSGAVENGNGNTVQKMVALLNENGSAMVFDNLDKVVTLAKSVFVSADSITITVEDLGAVRGALRLTGDPAAAKARALAKVQAKLDKVTADEAAQTASVATISYYSTGNATEQAFYQSKVQQLARVTQFKAWAQSEVTRLSA